MFRFYFFRTYTPIFSLQTLQLFDGGRGTQEYFLPRGAVYPSYATGAYKTVY